MRFAELNLTPSTTMIELLQLGLRIDHPLTGAWFRGYSTVDHSIGLEYGTDFGSRGLEELNNDGLMKAFKDLLQIEKEDGSL